MRVFDGDVKAAIHHMGKLAREGLRGIRAARKWPAMGAQRLRRMHPSDEPRTLAEPAGQEIPTFRIGTRGPVGRQASVRASMETRSFRNEYRETRERRLAGEDEPFPFGTYGQRVFHGAPVKAEPYHDALLAQPGPLPHEVLEELEGGRGDPGFRACVLDEAREDLAQRTAEVVEESELDYRPPDPNAGRGDDERPPAATKHRNDPRRTWRTNPRRLIVRRDARRGRPPKSPGSDPPYE